MFCVVVGLVLDVGLVIVCVGEDFGLWVLVLVKVYF